MGQGISLAPADELAALCRRYHVRRLALFGSVLRDDFGPQSNVDVLVEFEQGRTPGLGFFRPEEELSVLLGPLGQELHGDGVLHAGSDTAGRPAARAGGAL